MKRHKKKEVTISLPSVSCGGRTRTCDLQVMSLASYQLLHTAIYQTTFLICECKGTTFIWNRQIFVAKSKIFNSILQKTHKIQV